MLKDVYRYRWLLETLVSRDLTVRYRGSILGYLWSVLNPLCMMLVVSAVFSSFFKSSIQNFPVYMLSGNLIFAFYSESTSMALSSILNGSGLIRKVKLPIVVFPVSRVLSSTVNLLFSLVALVIVMIATKVKFTAAIIMLPMSLCYVLIFCIGCGLILSVINVYFRDILYIYGIFTTLIMYLTPIFYPAEMLPPLPQALLHLNPLFYFTQNFREIVLYGNFPSLRSNVVCFVIAFFFLMIGIMFFNKNKNNLIIRL